MKITEDYLIGKIEEQNEFADQCLAESMEMVGKLDGKTLSLLRNDIDGLYLPFYDGDDITEYLVEEVYCDNGYNMDFKCGNLVFAECDVAYKSVSWPLLLDKIYEVVNDPHKELVETIENCQDTAREYVGEILPCFGNIAPQSQLTVMYTLYDSPNPNKRKIEPCAVSRIWSSEEHIYGDLETVYGKVYNDVCLDCEEVSIDWVEALKIIKEMDGKDTNVSNC